ncbi:MULTISPECIES: DNA cytosine methyltransferase [Pseudomonas]|uniref:DNA (cytosine-5-)-methyltransferase n=2 Tax=Pseudomonas TaxID=286 RepID=A0A7L9GEA3_9PSED|nr:MULTISPECIES: DNA cytosine methyltransferase [Pseudomonas]AFK71737.1 C-5 cytosine-specific DNA methylase [Pseudomonas putida ND6]MEB3436341.1 DNA cytosine methyltransferase [Pseudomonas sp. A2]QOJ90721.1 DNA cytosine methyltransferase [Pseudomonas taiwanensis]WQQ38867.1 DNA cytosine methyltransferase [Pseudomonas putida]
MSAFQKKNPLDFKTQYGLGFDPQDDEIVVDFFCGGGGAGTGLEMGLGRPVTVAKNHSPAAISMHTANHPAARHFTTDVFEGDPDEECQGRPVGWFHMSPDCTHHSQAAGGQPRKREIRNLSWIGLKWAGKKKPRVISLENVKQILQWGPLMAKRDKNTGRVMKLDGTVAAVGERVPVQQQFLVPDPKRRGITWRRFVHLLEGMGYQMEWRIIKACDFGAPTSRERLFMIARCDGQPIVWPEPTHAKHPTKGQHKWRTAADCIDWSVPSKSIFGRKKELAAATLRRVAKGMKKFVLDNPQPFIVPIANWSGELAQSAHEPLRTVTSWPRGGSFAMASPVILPATHQGADRVNDPGDPLPTVTATNRGELMMASPVMVGPGGPVYAGKPVAADQPMGTLMTQSHRALASAHLVKFRFNSEGAAITDPVPTITSGGNYKRPAGAAHAMGVCTAFIEQANGGFNTTPAKGADEPLTTVTNTGSQQRLVTASLATLRRNCVGRPVDDLVPTMTAGAEHHALVEYKLSPEHEEGALRVAAFLISYYGTENISACDAPAPTVTTKDRLGLVTVFVKGTPYVIVDICLRMLQPHELYRAQGFPASYIIDKGADGKPFTKTEQVHMCGNSVSPPPMAAIARANDPWIRSNHKAAAA